MYLINKKIELLKEKDLENIKIEFNIAKNTLLSAPNKKELKKSVITLAKINKALEVVKNAKRDLDNLFKVELTPITKMQKELNNQIIEYVKENIKITKYEKVNALTGEIRQYQKNNLPKNTFIIKEIPEQRKFNKKQFDKDMTQMLKNPENVKILKELYKKNNIDFPIYTEKSDIQVGIQTTQLTKRLFDIKEKNVK